MKEEREYIRDGRAPLPKSSRTSVVMSANKAKNTQPEVALRRGLWQKGLRGYRLHYKKIAGSPDIVFPSQKLAIFVHGCFWHRCPYCELPLPRSNSNFWKEKFDKNLERDRKKAEALTNNGWSVVTIWECEIKSSLGKMVSKLEIMLKKKK